MPAFFPVLRLAGCPSSVCCSDTFLAKLKLSGADSTLREDHWMQFERSWPPLGKPNSQLVMRHTRMAEGTAGAPATGAGGARVGAELAVLARCPSKIAAQEGHKQAQRKIGPAQAPKTAARDDDDLASLALSAESLASRHAPAPRAAPAKTLAELEAEAARLNAQQQQPSQKGAKALPGPVDLRRPGGAPPILELEQRANLPSMVGPAGDRCRFARPDG